MARVDINLPDDMVDELKMEAGRRLGAKRGAFTEAIRDAVSIWLDPDTITLMEKYSNKYLDPETVEIMKKYSQNQTKTRKKSK